MTQPGEGVAEFEVVRNEVDGWDVIKKGETEALSNHASREDAEAAARQRGEQEQVDEVEVEVKEGEVHELDDERQGMRPAFFSLTGLLIAIGGLIVVIALIVSLTSFGA